MAARKVRRGLNAELEEGGDNGVKGRRVVRNTYKGLMNKTKVGWDQGREVGMPGVGGEWWGEKADNCT